MAGRVVVARSRDADIFVDDRVALAVELKGQDFFEGLELDAYQLKDGCQSNGVLDEIALDAGASSLTEKGTAERPPPPRPGLICRRCTAPRSRTHQLQVAVHRVLIERDQHVQAVAVLRTGSSLVRRVRKMCPPRMMDW